MSIRLKDLIKILSTLAAIVSGLAELSKQVNTYLSKKEEKENNDKNLGGDDIKAQITNGECL